ncbi:hypothetical protein HMT_11 [Clostridium phage HM T]|uniref:Uncharacterized protein n=1 Tax=Clostridium saccharoperbutylacetonicum N1-4(HMT) TaxID=931276 RepID=M1LPL2_9CLOT|nr:hypothetical protein [Clostridium saccharoperbutylacetonicum]AMB17423.1 hypothetical protein HMT_11 [Clostridium phage HM T]AGF54775.1 hypothetical protein Cspa_c09990 [Clostridium saccharoperbutylacetonicum N1-4(HMT)]NRT58704.1 hypothetical protein [Clostridium saccharoperbutylacetonicum]NSB27893.1 hypothetical protein [Clostridium saccharoperbutylacetonicum]NSB41376.1 hypothetical protein [Clostridium saccharoperbutylacetonicum]
MNEKIKEDKEINQCREKILLKKKSDQETLNKGQCLILITKRMMILQVILSLIGIFLGIVGIILSMDKLG